MIRTESTSYATDAGRTLIRIDSGKATVIPSICTADELDELASACSVAAEELRAGVKELEKEMEAI